jgi:class 3 adenylate cyclase/tetratricopeptide (TPR) repeat protein
VVSCCANCDHENRDGARFCEACGRDLTAPPPTGEQRKTVTLLFCDVTGSTALGERLDPESLRSVLARYFGVARLVVERHGGSVEKFIGDAVMAVFGIPVVHEDDALRAVRAAIELRDGMAELNAALLSEYGTTLELRMGVSTGEVVTGTDERLATGDAVNVAARLEQAARPGEILIGAETRALVRDAVEVGEAQSLELKGKAAPVAAYGLISVRAQPPSRRGGTAMVGRERELARLRAALAQAEADSSCQLFTVLGAAGVGKSRLSREFLGGLGEVTVVRGGCLSYGEGITYWPVVEVLRQLLGADPEQRLEQLALDPSAARALRAVLGEDGQSASVEEIAWAVRVLLAAATAEAPLVVVLDDIHWGEEAFLDLVDHVADLSRDAPILLLCMARPELLERRPNWGGGKLNATTVLLEPLAAGDAEALVESLLDDGPVDGALRSKILNAAEGNPLFVEEMVAFLRDSPDAAVAVPATIQALLAARLDQLGSAERDVLGRGSVEGRTFHRGAVQALSPDGVQLAAPLEALVRMELLRPDGRQVPGDDAFRFRHLLIRDAAYEALPKATRAGLHERFAGWLAARGSDLVELDEVVGYHLERAYHYRVELGPVSEEAREVSGRAAERLAAAGAKAAARGDVRAATHLLDRAVTLLPAGEVRRLRLLPSLARTLLEAGDWARSEEILTEALGEARAMGDRWVAADAAVAQTHLRLFTGPAMTHEMARQVLADAELVFREFGDEAGLARAIGLAAQLRMWSGEAAAAIEELERAARHAHTAGDRLQEIESLHYVLISAMHGPVSVKAGLERTDRMQGEVDGDHRLKVTVTRARALFDAMRGDFAGARAGIAAALALAEQLGLGVDLAGTQSDASEIEVLAGRPDAAEQVLRVSVAALEGRGDQGHLATVAPLLADVLYLQGRHDEAMPLTELVARTALLDDLDPQVAWRRVQAKVLAQRGEFASAERLARDAVDRAARGDYLNLHARAVEDLAEVLRLAGRPLDAQAELEVAIGLHDQKGNVVSAARTRARRDEISEA